MRTIISAAIALMVFSAFCQADDSVALPGVSSAGVEAWQPHAVRQINGTAQQIPLSAQFQIIPTDSWDQVAAVPYIIYMPEMDRLLMLASFGYPHHPFIMTSDDRGANWTDPYPVSVDGGGNPSGGLGTGLAYLGNGNALLYSDSFRRFSGDYGQSWGETVYKAPASDGSPWNIWDPPLVERDPSTGEVTRLAETGYAWIGDHQHGYIRFSFNEGRNWTPSIKVPQWVGVSEVALFRAGNNDLLGACRTDIPPGMTGIDHYEGLGVSVSQDDGYTWSTVEKLYNWGRHHPSLLMMPNGDIVMTYVVRDGYVRDENGFKQFGVEAVVSHDDGLTWDLDHKYILHAWVANRQGPNEWWGSPQATSSVLLPDGSILTTFGTGYRSEPGSPNPNEFAPREIGLVRWRLNPNPGNDDRTIRDAPFDSDLRNIFDIDTTLFEGIIPGDVSGDGFVGGDDLTEILTHWGQFGMTREQGDLNGDFFVGGDDYGEVLANWGEGTPPPPLAIATPEPATLGLLLVGGLALLRRKRSA